MPNRELRNGIDVLQSLIPATRSATGTGSWVDLRGYDSATVLVSVGTMVAGGTFTGQLQESVDGTALTGTVGSSALVGTFSNFGTNAPTDERVGYTGTCRYVRGVATFAGTGAGGIVGMHVIRGHAYRQPLA